MKKKLVLIFVVFFICNILFGGETNSLSEKILLPDGFKSLISIPATSVQDQGRSNTCWSFATLSFIESELLRTENKSYNFSEMFIVNHAYRDKADKYLRLHGNIKFGGGGEPHDVLNVINKHGLVPEIDYPGLIEGKTKHEHTELELTLKRYVDSLMTLSDQNITDEWKDGYIALLDSFLGKVPEKVNIDNKKITPLEYASSLPFNSSDYITISSFTHHPYYTSFILEIPDNWAWSEVYNIPLSELELIVDNALKNGYSMAWMADNSELGFMFKNGLAIAPKDLYDTSGNMDTEQIAMLSKEDFSLIYGFSTDLVDEIEVTPEFRQKAFDNYETTDDHAMHIIGLVEAPDGKMFYQVKNSWGIDNPFGGYLYVSKAYFKYKTISVLINKNAIPVNIRKKLQI